MTSPADRKDSGRTPQSPGAGSFSGSQLGFSFRPNPGVDSDEAFAELGPERNGVFLP